MRKSVAVTLSILLLVLALLVPSAEVSSSSSSSSEEGILFDLGNGRTYWSDAEGGEIKSTTENAASMLGLSIEFKDDRLASLDGVQDILIGTSSTSWKYYVWSETEWEYVPEYDLTLSFSGYVAWAFYPDVGSGEEPIKPVATPDSKYVWTNFQGSSKADGVSNSSGPDNPQLPVEWSKTYTTGYVNSGILVVGDLVYHTTGGDFYATGEDNDPWIYCLNRHTGENVWKMRYDKGAGYEVATPVIVDDMILLPTTSSYVMCLDRFDGTVLWKLSVPYEPPVDDKGITEWKGRSFITGPTTLVYDSGALFFGSADGRIYCYTVDHDGYEEQWVVEPIIGEGRGCFYFNAPVITSVTTDSITERVLFLGNYEGYIFAIRISDGSGYWKKDGENILGQSIIDMSASGVNTAVPGTPGSVGSIVAVSNGMLLVTCTDGAMTSLTGFITALNAATGEELWKIEAMMSSPIALNDGFIAYVSPAAKGAPTLSFVDSSEREVGYAVYKFNYNGDAIWQSKEYQWIKAPLTYADGVVYGIDYSTGYYYPTGGCLTALDAKTGDEEWRLLLSPYSPSSYSMVQPTVIDGKIYVGNDYGAIYCLSNTAGELNESDFVNVLDTPGFKHWSWYVLMIGVIVILATFVRLYR